MMGIESSMSKTYYFSEPNNRGLLVEMHVDEDFYELSTTIKLVDSSTGGSFTMYTDTRDINVRDVEDVRTAVHEAHMYLEEFFDDIAIIRGKIIDSIDDIAKVLIPKYNK